MNQWTVRDILSSLAIGFVVAAFMIPISVVIALMLEVLTTILSTVFGYNFLPLVAYSCVALSLLLFGLNIRSLCAKESPVPFIGAGFMYIGLVLGCSEPEVVSSFRSTPFILDFGDSSFLLIFLFEIFTYEFVYAILVLLYRLTIGIFSFIRK